MVGQNLIAKKSLPVKSLRKGIRGRGRESENGSVSGRTVDSGREFEI